MNCETVISDHTSACTIDTFFLQSVTSVMGSLGKSSQNVGVQSCYFNAIGHNVRGLSDGKLEELVRHMEDNDIFLVCLQETWRFQR